MPWNVLTIAIVALLVAAIWWIDRRERQEERDDLDLHAGWED